MNRFRFTKAAQWLWGTLLAVIVCVLPLSLSVAQTAIAPLVSPPPAQAPQRGGRGDPVITGRKIADGQAYVTVVELKHQVNSADNGRLLMAFEANGFNGIPIWESTDQGASWQFVANAHDNHEADRTRCDLHWQPHLTEMPRRQHGIAAGTVLLSASTVCHGGGMQVMHLRLFASDDFGRSWNYISTFADSVDGQPVWEPHLQILDDGTLVEFYSDETHKADGYNQMLGHKVSSDGGVTWGPEIYDTAMKGGVERPGMVIIGRLPNKTYVYNYEDVAGPVQANQVHLKFSKDGRHWGNPESRGTPVQTEAGQYPANTPNTFWFPIGGPDGLLVVTSRSSQGVGGDPAGNVLYWNNNLGAGPWWQAPTPAQKIGNNRAGWTQAMLLKNDGSLLHITSSGSPNPGLSGNPSNNSIIFNAVKTDFNRYEAENAHQQGSAIMRDASMSNGAKTRLGAKNVGKLTFDIWMAKAGRYNLAVNYAGIGFTAVPRLKANGKSLPGTAAPAPIDPARAALRAVDLGTRGNGQHSQLSTDVTLRAGRNRIEILGGDYALDIDYLEVTPS